MRGETMNMQGYHKRTHLSPSSLATLGRCPRRFFLKNGLLLQTPGLKSALCFGEAIHRAMPHVQRGDIASALGAFATIWKPELEDRKRNISRAEVILRTFMDTRKGSLYEIQAPPESNVEDKISPDEVSFAIDLGLPIPIVGRIDAVGKHRDTGEFWGIEYKTTSELSSRFFEGFQLNPQVAIYALALNMLSGEPYRGVIVEGLQVAITACNILAFPVRVEEQTFSDTVNWVKDSWELIERCENSGVWPKNLCGCNPYASFGQPGYTCEFVQMCLSQDWESLVGLYEVGEAREFKVGAKEKP